MSFKQLVGALAAIKSLPVPVDEIRDWIIKSGLQDEIWYVPVELDRRLLYGAIRQYTYRNGVYSEPTRAANIYYAKTLNVCWSRFVCCKEMMHIFDAPAEQTATRELLAQLALDLGSPPSSPEKMTPQYVSDWIAITKALIALVPESALERLRPLHAGGLKKPYDIALFLRIPEFYVDYLFSDRFRANRTFFMR